MKKTLALIILTILIVTALPLNAFAEGKYISYIGITDGIGFDDPEESLEEYGYTVLWTDLNLGTGKDDLLMGYKTTDDYSKAIYDIVIADGENDYNNSFSDGYLNLTDEEYGGAYFRDELNEGAGGDYLFLIGSRDPSKGDPITDLFIKEGIEPPDDSGWEVVCYYNSTTAADMNKGAGGAYLYLFIKRESAAITSSVFTDPASWLLVGGVAVIVVGACVAMIIVNKKKKAKAVSKEL